MISTIRSAALGACALVGMAMSPAFADAIPYPNPGTIAPTPSFSAQNTGDLVAYFYGSSASYEETLGLEVNGVLRTAGVLNNKSSSQGDSFNFGSVNAGDVLTYFINVLTTGDTFYSDPTRNSDRQNHTYATAYTGGVSTIPAGTFVGFEDLPASQWSGGQPNYDDETFVFTNTLSSVPLPASAPMFGGALLGLVALSFIAKRKKASTAA